ncbi:uncharacterized protein LOC108090375 [Drosophila ficusphila]|uniref:uncharacterized protein LOC108090375 n=1 Tax=Drosophila ficusphila TaxID=30025 RepID=UPI0007E6A75C|nr:uncharacterized protein LOC108090375 [Drosophila ficusphila]
MTTSVLATMCAERLTKLLVRYSRTQPSVVRNESNCVNRVLNPLPKTEATAAYLKPMTADGQVPLQTKHAGKWQPSISSIGQRFQREAMDELSAKAKDRLLPKNEPRYLSFSKNQSFFPNKSRGLEDWKHLGTGRYSPSFATMFQGQSAPSAPKKSFNQHFLSLDHQKLFRDCF